MLLHTIQDLKPAGEAAGPSSWRTYRYLFLRYVQALPPIEVARELGISERQARRTYREAIDALASVLWDRATPEFSALSQASSTQSDDDDDPVGREVAHLSSAGHGATTDLSDVVQGLRSILQPLARQHNCALEISIEPTLPRLAIDRAVARQIVLHLCVAALECGPTRVVLAAESRDHVLRLTMRLEGARRATVQPDDARVAVARRLAESEGGRMVSSDGMSILIELPTARRPVVVVVDDNPDVAAVLRRYIESAGLEVVTVDSGEVAVELAREIRPAAITLDVMMTGQDGWETLQQLKNYPATQEIPVLICSVLREEELARFLGAAELLLKPVSRADLLAALSRHGLGSSMRQSNSLG